MEASVAGNAGPAGGDAAAGQGGAGEGGGVDLSGLTSTLAGVQETQQEMRQALATIMQQQGGEGAGPAGDDAAPEVDVTAAEYDFGFLENEEVTADPEKLRAEFESSIQKALAPILQGQQELQQRVNQAAVNAEFDDFVSRYPEMGEKETFDPILKASRDYCQLNGFPPQLAETPRFLELMYLAERAISQSQDEEADGPPSVAHLEGGGGARQVTADQMKELGKLVVSGGRNDRGSMPFG
jgi:hypothetical protein